MFPHYVFITVVMSASRYFDPSCLLVGSLRSVNVIHLTVNTCWANAADW